MKFSYEDLLSGDFIFVDGVGHFRSPQVKELKPVSGIGARVYHLYLNILSWNKSDYLKFMEATNARWAALLINGAELNVFDIMTLVPGFRQTLRDALAFFIGEEIKWDERDRRFLTVDKEGKAVGEICRTNFDDARDMMLQMNYMSLDTTGPPKHSSKKTEALWERAQKRLKEESLKPANKNFTIGNIISKLCASPCGYTLLNVYDLTIFQLYDQFFQYGYLRAMNLNEIAFSNHGGDKFNLQDWLKPIFQI